MKKRLVFHLKHAGHFFFCLPADLLSGLLPSPSSQKGSYYNEKTISPNLVFARAPPEPSRRPLPSCILYILVIEHVVSRVLLTSRTTSAARWSSQSQVYFLSRHKTGVKVMLVLEVVEQSLWDEAAFKYQRLPHLYRQSHLRLCSARARGKCVVTVFLLQLPSHFLIFFCFRHFNSFCAHFFFIRS